MPNVGAHKMRLGALLLGAVTLLLFGVGAVKAREDGPKDERRELWLFFSPASRGLSRELGRLKAVLEEDRDLRFRPSLLVPDLAEVKRPSEEFARAVKEFQRLGPRTTPLSLAIWDREGLDLARRLGIDRLPAYALLTFDRESRIRKAHVAYGVGADLGGLLRCR